MRTPLHLCDLASCGAFLFGRERPTVLAVVRMAVCLVLACEVAGFFPYVIELYSTAGPPISWYGEIGFHPPVPSPWAAVAWHAVLQFALLSAMAGSHTRLCLAIALLVYPAAGLLDATATFTKYTALGTHALFWLFWSESHRQWSFDAAAANREPSSAEGKSARCGSPIWPLRLLQIQMCYVYWGAAVTKIQQGSFISGELVTFSLLDDRWTGGGLAFPIALSPGLTILSSWSVLAFEVFFPVLIWFKAWRPWMLLAGVTLHLGMWLLLDLGIFSPLMIALLLSFSAPSWWERAVHWSARACRRGMETRGSSDSARPAVPLPASALGTTTRLRGWSRHFVWCGMLVITIGAEVAVQRFVDWYGLFGRPMPDYARMADADVDEMFAQQLPPFEDYLHHAELGTRVRGNRAWGERHRFTTGETAYVVARFYDNHPKLEWVGLLVAPDGQTRARFVRIVEPGVLITVNGFELTDELPSGPYRVVLQIDGVEVLDRHITLGPPRTPR